jgi:hypothetical protein
MERDKIRVIDLRGPFLFSRVFKAQVNLDHPALEGSQFGEGTPDARGIFFCASPALGFPVG